IAAPSAGAQRSAGGGDRDSVSTWLRNAEREGGVSLPGADALRSGDVTVAAGESVQGDLVTLRGDLRVAGTVDGDVVALGGNVTVQPGARISGSVIAAGGTVQLEGGEVGGEIVETVLQARESPTVHRSAIALALGWALVLATIGLVVLLLARRNLERVADAVRVRFGRSLLFGLVGQLAFFPALLTIIVVLAITIVGLLVIPIALVAFLTAVAGAITLGFLAVAFASGDTLASRMRGSRSSPVALSLFIGLAVYVAAWVLAAALANVAVAGALLRAVVGLMTWVALTTGLGATILTRGGTRDAIPQDDGPIIMPDDMWQTPTPVSGVTAARRPTPAPGSHRL
ncbi:MAG TPA: polymer-forming cytoskeletal protein, partial [Gemmatimonadaceae bacterium]|nr:polymer-forming cytoskeletal protein [Gemmatimonadaceae bacterium]